MVERIPERFLFDVQVVSRLRKLVERLDPDMIQTHASKAHFLMRCSGLGKNRPWIAFHHGYTNTDFRSPLYNNLDRWSLQAPDRIVTVSRPRKSSCCVAAYQEQRITVMHNAVPTQSLIVRYKNDASIVRQKKIDLGVSAGRKTYFMCRPSFEREGADRHGRPLLLRLRKLRPDLAVRLMIIGDGPEREPISQAIQVRRSGKQYRIYRPFEKPHSLLRGGGCSGDTLTQ